MIISLEIHRCAKCHSSNIIKNGCDYKQAQKYHCKDCRANGALKAQQGYDDEDKNSSYEPIGSRPGCAVLNVSL